MALFTESKLRDRVRSEINKSIFYSDLTPLAKLNESIKNQSYDSKSKIYDIFLSHSSNDAELVEGLKLVIEDLGFSVYVDWIEDKQLNREHVTKDTALVLRQRMNQCKSLIYAFSENAKNSKWMPWELGYFDALKGQVSVLPISETYKSSFKGSEYLGIYNYVGIDKISGGGKNALWVHEQENKYVIYNEWLIGDKPEFH